MTEAATKEPARDPATTLAPISNAADAPAKESSLMPCTANGRSRIITKTPTTPPTTPRIAPATSEFFTRTSRAP